MYECGKCDGIGAKPSGFSSKIFYVCVPSHIFISNFSMYGCNGKKDAELLDKTEKIFSELPILFFLQDKY